MTWNVGLDTEGGDDSLTPVRAAGPRVLTGATDSGTLDAYFDGPRGDIVLHHQNDVVTPASPTSSDWRQG